MTEFSIGSTNYRTDRMAAMTQFHVARRVAPLIGSVSDLIAGGGLTMNSKISEAVVPLTDALSKLSDEDCERVIGDCLNVVRREQPGGIWAPVWNKGAKRPQFDDIDVSVMMQLTARVVLENVQPFFPIQNSAIPPPGETLQSTG